MKLALLSVLLAFAAPVPFAEATAGLEEEIVAESARASKSASARRIPVLKLARQAVASHPPARALDASLPPREPAVWTPRLFSRPPPLG
jgi:hypothetical protein